PFGRLGPPSPGRGGGRAARAQRLPVEAAPVPGAARVHGPARVFGAGDGLLQRGPPGGLRTVRGLAPGGAPGLVEPEGASPAGSRVIPLPAPEVLRGWSSPA